MRPKVRSLSNASSHTMPKFVDRYRASYRSILRPSSASRISTSLIFIEQRGSVGNKLTHLHNVVQLYIVQVRRPFWSKSVEVPILEQFDVSPVPEFVREICSKSILESST